MATLLLFGTCAPDTSGPDTIVSRAFVPGATKNVITALPRGGLEDPSGLM